MPAAKRRDSASGSPFFWVLFFGEAKKSASAAGPRPGQATSANEQRRRVHRSQPHTGRAVEPVVVPPAHRHARRVTHLDPGVRRRPHRHQPHGGFHHHVGVGAQTTAQIVVAQTAVEAVIAEPAAQEDFLKVVNPKSLEVVTAKLETSLRATKASFAINHQGNLVIRTRNSAVS